MTEQKLPSHLKLMTKSRKIKRQEFSYFCKLCRSYHVRSRQQHLIRDHNADMTLFNKGLQKDVLEVIFIMNVQQ